MGTIVVLTIAVVAALMTTDDDARFEGLWRYDRFTVGGMTDTVQVDVNAAGDPWFEIDGGTMSGHAGCNAFGGPYLLEGSELLGTTELAFNASWCGPESGELMAAELAFQEVVWRDGGIDVVIDGDRMTWTAGSRILEFVSIGSPPTTEPFEPEPQTSVGRLDCSPGFVTETRVPDEGQEPLDIAREADPRVVEVEAGDPLRHSGLDARGEVIVELALGDMPGADYQVWTCAD